MGRGKGRKRKKDHIGLTLGDKIRKQATEEAVAEPGTVIPQHGPKLCQRGEGFSVLSLLYSILLLPLSHLLWLVTSQP